MKIYNYHPLTKEFLSEGIADADPLVEGNWLIPAHATTVPVPEIQSGHVPVFDGSQWLQAEDHRGVKIYDIATAQRSEIKDLGELPDGVTTIAPDVEFPKWNGKKWVTDKAAKKAADIAAAETQKQYLLPEAAEAIAPLQDAVDLDMATPEEESRLKAWKKYRVLLSRVDTSLAPDIAWPVKP